MWLENSTFFFIGRAKAEHTRVLRLFRNRKRVDSAGEPRFVSPMWRWLLALVLIASPAVAQEQLTAYDALRVIGTQVNRAYMSRLVSVTGVNGDPQPTRWRVLVADRTVAAGVREFEVTDGTVIAERTPEGAVAAGGAPINTTRLNLDSSGAFTVANYTADKSHMNFSSVSYVLRNNERGYPVWIVTLHDSTRRPLGTIYIGANKGNVTRVEGMFRGRDAALADANRPPAPSRTQDDYYEETEEVEEGYERDGDENIVKAKIKGLFRQTKRDAQRMFARVRRSFEDFSDRW